MVVDLNISRNSLSREWFGLSRGEFVVCAMVLMGCVSWCVLVGGEEVGALRSAEESRAYLRGQTTEVDRTWLRERAREHLEGCRLEASDGTVLFSPDGSGHYKALWTRDFRYMVRYAGDLIAPELVRGAPDLAARLLSETIRDFRERGVHECVGESEYRVPKYVASITNVYGLVRE